MVSGGTRGLGREIVEHFSAQGDVVCFIYLKSKDLAKDICDRAKENRREVQAFKGDVAHQDTVRNIVKEVFAKYHAIDVLVANAGSVTENLLIKTSEEEWDSIVDCNLKGVYLLSREVSRVMLKQKKGHIITISSIVGLEGRKALASYSAAKAGLISLTKSLAMELGKANVKANVVIPGFLLTNMTKNLRNTCQREVIKQKNVLNRLGDIKEVGRFLHHLSNMNNVSGQVFNLDSRILK